jgi:hypothetical protein
MTKLQSVRILIKYFQESFLNNPFSELEIPLSPTPEALAKAKLKVKLPKIVISNENQHDSLMNCCISILTYSSPDFCNLKREQGIAARNVMLKVFSRKSLLSKTNAVIFFRKYFESLVMINNEDTHFFISILHTLSIIYKDISTWIRDDDQKTTFNIFQESVQYLLRIAPLEEMKFDNHQNVQRMVAHTSDIMFHQIKNARSFWYKEGLIYCVSNMVKIVLENFDYNSFSTEGLLVLAGTYHPDIINLMKYPIIAELETTSNFHSQAIKNSKTWRNVHNALLTKIEHLQKQETNLFEFEIQDINECFFLAVQVEFGFTQRHQFRYGMHPKTCTSVSSKDAKILPVCPLMKFNDWNYKHINLEMFEDIESITQKLLNILENCVQVESIIVACFIDIFWSLLKLSANSQLIETKKLILFAVVASPFYKCLKSDEQFKKLAGFQKVMAYLPKTLQTFFDSGVEPHHLKEMKCESVIRLSQLKISAISISCWWLTENIMQYVTTSQTHEQLKSTLFSNFVNFIVNNGDKFAQCIDRYQKMLIEADDNCVVIEHLHEILCLSSGKVVILKIQADENHFNHFIVCDNCKISKIFYPKDPKTNETHRRMALIKDTKGLLVSPDRIAQTRKQLKLDVPKLMAKSNEFMIELLSKIPALLNHSKDFQEWIESDKAKALFEAIFVEDEKVLEKLNMEMNDILRNIKQMNLSEAVKDEILANCFTAFSKICIKNAAVEDQNLQHLIVNIAFAYASNVQTETSLVKCFKVFSFFIVQNSSKIMGEASNLALTMAKRSEVSLDQLFVWHRSFIIRHIVNLCILNFFKHKTSLLNSLINVSFLVF